MRYSKTNSKKVADPKRLACLIIYVGLVVLMEEDEPSKLSVQLSRYFIGSGFHLKQIVTVYDNLFNDWASLVPVL